MRNGIDTTAWLYHGCRLTLGAAFLFAAIMKLLDLGAFSATVSRLFGALTPDAAMVLALLLVIVEAALGAMLALNWRTREAALATGALLVSFIGVQFWLMQQGGSCNCFGSLSDATTGAEMIRNLMLIGLCIALFRTQEAIETKTPKGGEPFGA